MDKQTIEISKNRYDNIQYRQVIDTSFSEIKNSREPLSLDKFFSDFNEIFLDIPNEGNQSLRSIFNRVDSVLNQGPNEKDIEIENLLTQIDTLQQEINKLRNTEGNQEESHPLFENGQLLKDSNTGKKYIMERGKKRIIMDGDTMKVLIQLSGGKANTPFEEVCIQLPSSIINGITDGIPINDSNFNLSESTIDEETQRNIWNRDWSDPSLNLNWVKNQYSYEEYLEVLSRDLEEKASVIEYVEDQIDLRRNNLDQLRLVDDEPRKEELRNEISDLSATLESVVTRESEVAQALTALLNNPDLWEEAESEQVQPVGDNPFVSYSVLRSNTQTLFDEGFLEKNNVNPLLNGLEQAKDQRSDDPRRQQRWYTDIKDKNSGTKKNDLHLVLEKTVNKLQENPNSEGII